jgi:rhamnosyltransferase subunit B
VTPSNTSTEQASGKRIVLTAVGSLGDLHPYLALARELARRGHRPVVATVPTFRERVEAAGLEFFPIRATTTEEPSAELMRRVFHGRTGVEFIVRGLILPALRTAYEDTVAAAEGADLLVSHPLTLATRFVAEKRKLPWVSTQLAPFGMLSATDPPRLPGVGWLEELHAPAAVWRLLFRLGARQTRRWLGPYESLRAELGLPDGGNPLFAGAHAPLLDLALFSPLLGPPQPDWPRQTVATGFAFFEQPEMPDPELEAWLAAGPPPIVFTLGSSAVMDPGTFFRESAGAARRIGRRALLLGANPDGLPRQEPADFEIEDDEGVMAAGYGNYARIFPRAAAIVHQGGVGTTAEALRAGRPMLVMPYGADQPDNGARVERLAVGRVIGRQRYRAHRAGWELSVMLNLPGCVARAEAMGQRIRAEKGTETACDHIEALLQRGAGPAA